MEAALVDAVDECVTANPEVTVRILLDYSRALRGRPNSVTIATHLVAKHRRPGQVEVLLYQMPQMRRPPLRWLAGMMPSPLNEVLAVSHLKAFTFDDNSLVSGANLSEAYFVNRQDRYLEVMSCPQLSCFYHGLVDALAPTCWKVGQHGGLERYESNKVKNR
ncbi:unnamed protein product [Discosporangium mesarthrocarpum]